MPIFEFGLDTANARRAILTKGRDHLVFAGIEAFLNSPRKLLLVRSTVADYASD